MTAQSVADRSMPLRERKKLHTRRALAEAALRLFSEKGFDATTLDELAEEAEISKSTFFRFFPAKEAAAIEAEHEVWTAYLGTLADQDLRGPILGELHRTLTEAITSLDPGWDERFLATRRLVIAEPALFKYVEHYRATVREEAIASMAEKLHLDPEDVRLPVLTEIVINSFSLSGRKWVREGGKGGRKSLLKRFDEAVEAVPASLDLTGRG